MAGWATLTRSGDYVFQSISSSDPHGPDKQSKRLWRSRSSCWTTTPTRFLKTIATSRHQFRQHTLLSGSIIRAVYSLDECGFPGVLSIRPQHILPLSPAFQVSTTLRGPAPHSIEHCLANCCSATLIQLRRTGGISTPCRSVVEQRLSSASSCFCASCINIMRRSGKAANLAAHTGETVLAERRRC